MKEFGHDFAIVTPGVRLAGSGPHDQARVVTPAEAIAAGASHIVVGRPITELRRPSRGGESDFGADQYPGSSGREPVRQLPAPRTIEFHIPACQLKRRGKVAAPFGFY